MDILCACKVLTDEHSETVLCTNTHPTFLPLPQNVPGIHENKLPGSVSWNSPEKGGESSRGLWQGDPFFLFPDMPGKAVNHTLSLFFWKQQAQRKARRGSISPGGLQLTRFQYSNANLAGEMVRQALLPGEILASYRRWITGRMWMCHCSYQEFFSRRGQTRLFISRTSSWFL